MEGGTSACQPLPGFCVRRLQPVCHTRNRKDPGIFSTLLPPDAEIPAVPYFSLQPSNFSLVHESRPVSRIAWKAAWRVTTSEPKAFAPDGNLSKSTLLPIHSIRGVAPKSVLLLAKRRPAGSEQKSQGSVQRVPAIAGISTAGRELSRIPGSVA